MAKQFFFFDKDGNEFALQGFIEDGYFLIPYKDSQSYKPYWDCCFTPQSLWIKITENFNFDNYTLTKEHYESIVSESLKKEQEILEKYQNSF